MVLRHHVETIVAPTCYLLVAALPRPTPLPLGVWGIVTDPAKDGGKYIYVSIRGTGFRTYALGRHSPNQLSPPGLQANEQDLRPHHTRIHMS